MKAIFLDFDGVIRLPVRGGGPNIEAEFSSDCMKRVSRLAQEADAQIVVSSDWRERYATWEDMTAFLEPRIPRELLHREWATPVLTEVADENRIPRIVARGAEIVSWLADHSEVSRFVILDDMHSKYFPLMRDNLVTCQLLDGFTEERFKKAAGILKAGPNRKAPA